MLSVADAERVKYAVDVLDTHNGLPHCIRRKHIFSDVVALYRDEKENELKEYPFHVKYANEKAVDTGGVCRDMLSAFWQEAFATAFDGRNVVVPSIHPHTNMDVFVTLGTIFSHGYNPVGFCQFV